MPNSVSPKMDTAEGWPGSRSNTRVRQANGPMVKRPERTSVKTSHDPRTEFVPPNGTDPKHGFLYSKHLPRWKSCTSAPCDVVDEYEKDLGKICEGRDELGTWVMTGRFTLFHPFWEGTNNLLNITFSASTTCACCTLGVHSVHTGVHARVRSNTHQPTRVGSCRASSDTARPAWLRLAIPHTRDGVAGTRVSSLDRHKPSPSVLRGVCLAVPLLTPHTPTPVTFPATGRSAAILAVARVYCPGGTVGLSVRHLVFTNGLGGGGGQ